MTLIAEPASYLHRPELEEPAREAWKEARKWLEMDFDAKRLIGILDSRKDIKIAVVVKVQKTEMVDGSLYKYGDGTWARKGYNGGAIYWWIQDKTTIEKPEKGLQDPRISLIHEMYHAWQCLYSRGCKDLQGLYAVGTDKWFEKQLRVEQACVNFEKEVAEGCGTAVRDDYWHYQCRGAVCEFRRAFSKQLGKLKNAERYYCNSKNFTSTYELLTGIWADFGNPLVHNLQHSEDLSEQIGCERQGAFSRSFGSLASAGLSRTPGCPAHRRRVDRP